MRVDWRKLLLIAVFFVAWCLLALRSQCNGDKPRPLDVVPAEPQDKGGGLDRTFALADLTAAEAARLQGKQARFRIVLTSGEDQEGKYTLYDCLEPREVGATVWLLPGQEPTEQMTVEARLVVIDHKTWTAPDGTVFPGFREYRLADAVRVLP
jgi:hypothetical protein